MDSTVTKNVVEMSDRRFTEADLLSAREYLKALVDLVNSLYELMSSEGFALLLIIMSDISVGLKTAGRGGVPDRPKTNVR